ncbi:MAG TPA: hypothetical protein PKD84_02390 [Propionicimonas sp.]|nr:hypothetical protein [Propionicimonas sp.]
MRPRRALGPLPDDFDDPVVPEVPSAPEASFDDPALTDTGMMRRLALNPDGTLGDLVPPPRPVLPSSEAALPASAGRRFSANDSPYDVEWAAPRRSAASVSSPPPAYEPLLPPVSRPTQPPEVTVSYQPSASRVADIPAYSMAAPALGSHALTPEPATPDPTEAVEAPVDKVAAKEAAAEAKADAKRAKEEAKADARAAKADAKAEALAAKQAEKEAKQAEKEAKKAAKKNGGTPAAASQPDIAARLGTPELAAAATQTAAAPAKAEASEKSGRSIRPAFLVMAGVVVILLLVVVAVVVVLKPPSTLGSPGPAAVDPVLTDSEVAVLGAGPWTSAPTTETAICLSGGTTVKADRSVARLLSNTTGSSVLQSVDSYADAATATEAYSQRLTQVGTCADDAATVQSASTVTGLGDTSDAVTLKARDKTGATHTVLLVRSDRTVNIFDVATPEAIPLTALAATSTASLNRQCAGTTCPSAISVEASVPAAGDPAGWLVPADLPLITPGVGKWVTTDFQVKSRGSGCEGIDLAKVSNTTSSGQRTLILADDPAAVDGSVSFGTDQVNYEFSSAKAAQDLAATLTKNINNCASRQLTATVDGTDKVTGTGADAAAISGQTWTVTHKISGKTLTLRLAVVTSGNRVTYLLANPLKNANVSDSEWTAIALRAGQRASQTP